MTKKRRTQKAFDIVDKLSAIIRNVQQSLQCAICLHMISDPMRTICGHYFCRTCTHTVLQKRTAQCPLCETVLQRESIFTDEPLVDHINRLHNLIKAIQQDSGIDLMPHFARPCSTRETGVPKIVSIEENPNCSYITSSLEKKQVELRSNQKDRSRNVPKEKKVERKDNNKREINKEYLLNSGVSGVEPLASDKSANYFQNKTSTDDKVQNWLKSLSETEVLNVNGDTTVLLDDDSNETVPISVSQNVANERLETYDADDAKTIIIDRKSLNRRESDKNESGDKEDDETGPFTKHLMDKYNFDAESLRPSTSSAKKSHDDGKERNQEVRRTSLKENWTTVVQRGKEMRTKKKKFKALNVSVESTRSRSLDDAKKTEADSSREINSSRHERKQNRFDILEPNPRIIFQEKDRSIKEQGVTQKESPHRKSRDASEDEHEQFDTSYITLKGEKVRIENLDGNQMTEIIGIASYDKQYASNSSSDTIIIDREDQARDYIASNEFAQVPSKITPPRMSNKLSLRRSAETKLNVSPAVNIDSWLQDVKRDLSGQIDQNKGNTNTKKRSTETKLSESLVDKIDSQLRTVKSDLSLQIDRNKENSKKRTTETKLSEFPAVNVDLRLHTAKSDLSLQIDRNKENSKKRTTETKLSEFPAVNVDLRLHTAKSDLSLQIDRNKENSKKRTTETKLSEFPAVNVDLRLHWTKSDLNRETDQNKGNFTKNKSTETKLSESPVANIDLRLQTVKSDLNRQIDQNKGNFTKKKSTETKLSEFPAANIDFTSKNKSLVTFKKLGKICRRFKKKIKFFYLGSTRRETSISSMKVRRNFISENFGTVQLDTEMCTSPVDSVNNFGERNLITVNDRPNGEEVENVAAVKETKKEQSKESAKNVAAVKETKKEESKESVKNVADVKETKKEQLKESVKNTEPCALNVPRESQDSDVSLKSLDVNEEKEIEKGTSPGRVRMFSPMDDSQLKLLSLGSPMNEWNDFQAKEPSETPKKSKIPNEEECVDSSDSSLSPNVFSNLKRKWLNSRDASPEINKTSEQAMSNLHNSISAMKNDCSNSSVIDGKKQYRRILPLASDSDPASVVSVNELLSVKSSISNKRKRNVLSDSDSETDFSMIENWCSVTPSEKHKEKSEVFNLANEPCRARDRSSTSFSKISKLSSLPRKLADFADNRSDRKSSSNGSQGRKTIVLDEDSPDFGSTIDKMKDIKSKGVVSKDNTNQYLLQDNLDEVFANVNTADLVADCDVLEMHDDINEATESVCKKRKLSTVSSNKRNNSDKENDFMTRRGEFEKSNMTQENVNPVVSTSKASLKIQANKVTSQNLIKQNERVKGSFEDDSFMNVTEDYLMLQQFEVDLLGKSLSSKLGWAQKTPQKLEKYQIPSTNQKDIEAVEDDDNDIIQSTPESNKKIRQRVNSQRGSAIATPTMQILKPSNSPSTGGKSSSDFSTPNSKRIRPLCQSTPKSSQSTTSTSFLRRLAFPATRTIDKCTKSAVSVENNPSDRRQGLCFTCSSLTISQIEDVEKLAIIMNATYVPQFKPEVTHVIVGTDKNKEANKTLKYLQGIVHRKWVVSFQWAVDSIKEKRLMNEEDYEAVDCSTLEAGPRKSRLSDNGLFTRFAFLCVGPFTDVTVKQYQDLLRATGASVVESFKALAAEKKLRIIVVQADTSEHKIIEWYKGTRAISVDHEWIVECISQYKLISLYPYLQELSRLDASAVGFPECLLEEDPDETRGAKLVRG